MAPTIRAGTFPGVVVREDGRVAVLPLREFADKDDLDLAILMSAVLARGLLVVV